MIAIRASLAVAASLPAIRAIGAAAGRAAAAPPKSVLCDGTGAVPAVAEQAAR